MLDGGESFAHKAIWCGVSRGSTVPQRGSQKVDECCGFRIQPQDAVGLECPSQPNENLLPCGAAAREPSCTSKEQILSLGLSTSSYRRLQ